KLGMLRPVSSRLPDATVFRVERNTVLPTPQIQCARKETHIAVTAGLTVPPVSALKNALIADLIFTRCSPKIYDDSPMIRGGLKSREGRLLYNQMLGTHA